MCAETISWLIDREFWSFQSFDKKNAGHSSILGIGLFIRQKKQFQDVIGILHIHWKWTWLLVTDLLWEYGRKEW